MSKESDEYERVTRIILDSLREHLGWQRVEGSKQYQGRVTRRPRQIDATAYRTDGGAVLIECKRHARPLEAKEVQAFYYLVTREIGAAGGLLVTSVGYQAAAQMIAEAERIQTAILNADATEHDYLLSVAGQLFKGMSISDQGFGTEAVSVIKYPHALPLMPTSIVLAPVDSENAPNRSLSASQMTRDGFTLHASGAGPGGGHLTVEVTPHGYGEDCEVATPRSSLGEEPVREGGEEEDCNKQA